MTDKRRGLGRGLGALIPNPPAVTKPGGDRPVDVFFPERTENHPKDGSAAARAARTEAGWGRAGLMPDQPATTRSDDPAAAPGPAPQSSASDPAASDRAASEPSTPDLDGLIVVPGVGYAEIPVADIRPNPKQPRSVFDEEAMAELVHSIREIGVLQPVVVRPVKEADAPERYELIMGERRWRASKEAGLTALPAIVRETADDDLLRDALLENLHRSQLNALEEAAAYQQLLDDFGCTHEDLAARLGRSRPQISNTIRLLRLPPPVQRRVAAGVLSAGHARAILGLDDTGAMEKLAGRIVAEGLSVRAVEEIVAMGEGEKRPAAKRKVRPGQRTGELDDVARRLGDHFDTRVSVALGRSRGKLTVEFATVDDLNRILGLMAPGVRRPFSGDEPIED